MKASDFLRFDSKKKVYIAKSLIKNGGNGLYSLGKYIKNTPMVIYYGSIKTPQEIYDVYIDNPNKYYQISDYLRGTPNSHVVCGDKSNDNLNLSGVYVNDISSISCSKNEINSSVLKKYAESIQSCNLSVVATLDYPVYVTNQRIKKGEELYVHYGIGYWLSHIRFTPEEISELNNKYEFMSFY